MIKPKVKTREVDRGFKAVGQLAARFANDPPVVAVGVTGKAAVEIHKNAQKSETVVQIAAKHEFGEGVPQRSFIRSSFDENVARYRDASRNAFAATLRYAIKNRDGNWTPKTSTALKRLGLLVEGDIKKKIAAGIPPPLTPYTLARKGKNKTTPLIDTGQMRASIISVVYPRRPK